MFTELLTALSAHMPDAIYLIWGAMALLCVFVISATFYMMADAADRDLAADRRAEADRG